MKIIQLELNKLYPLTRVENLDPSIIEKAIIKNQENNYSAQIVAFEYKGNYFVFEGVYDLIAYAKSGKAQISARIVDRDKLGFWKDNQQAESELKALGISALLDYEALTGIKLDLYPLVYLEQ